ncbi:DUF3883 domain-containing protein [Novosphingobium decolorationis]|uniref:DUF3883 domain-containing protein n=1 Tax=Novosphingobium decolorationis TaxID=2698673 RepID=A0ABX8E8I2_9SPHN|nr:DUF3883 domain-containing protein [Novosphingobium decolorationis]QVM85255.1 DUF3883 domain-containing protein [Novosphingobium decolorationis]
MKRVLWIKIGWADCYQGDLVRGNFDYPQQRRAEMFNFLPNGDGTYCGYTGSMSGSTPSSEKPDDWLVIFIARHPELGGMYVVGWYEGATLGESRARDDVALPEPMFGDDKADEAPVYSITAKSAYLVPPEYRLEGYSHKTIGSARFSYLSGPGIERTADKAEVRNELLKRVRALRSVAIQNPEPGVDLRKVDPLLDLGTAAFRAEVEKAAIKAVIKTLKAEGFKVKSHEHLNRGYDLKATHRETGQVLRVEVKGTAGRSRRFFLSENEKRFLENSQWRFAIVTTALEKPTVEIFDLSKFKAEFDLSPLAWIGREKVKDPA